MISTCYLVFGQSNIRLNNYWANTLTINPAAIYDKYDAVFSVAANKHWVGIPGAPVTYLGTATTYIEQYHTQLGLKFVQDKIGYTSSSNLNLSYGYVVFVNYDWQLHLGIAGNYQRMNYDVSQVDMAEFDPDVLRYLEPQNNFNADAGFEITTKSLRFGAASQNIFSLFSEDANRVQANTNFVYLRYRQYNDNVVNLGAGVCGIQYGNLYQTEFSLTNYFKFSNRSGLVSQPDLFNIGLFYRTQNELGLVFGFNVSESIQLSYSYDYHLGGIRYGSYGTNEFMLVYNLKKKPVCRNCWY